MDPITTAVLTEGLKDPKKLGEGLHETGKGLHETGKGIGEAGRGLGDGIGEAGRGLGDGIGGAATGVGDGVGNAANGIGGGFREARFGTAAIEDAKGRADAAREGARGTADAERIKAMAELARSIKDLSPEMQAQIMESAQQTIKPKEPEVSSLLEMTAPVASASFIGLGGVGGMMARNYAQPSTHISGQHNHGAMRDQQQNISVGKA